MIDVDRCPGSQTRLGRFLRAPLSLVPKTAVMPILQGPLRGKKWIVGSGIHRLWLGSYEPEKMTLAATLVRSGDTVFDIGANVGIYTLLFSQAVGDHGHVVALEPSSRNIDFLRQHLRLNEVGNVSVIEAAASATTGTARFDATGDPCTGHLATDGAFEVPTMTVDEIVRADDRRPTLLKIDVEGAELDVLAGADMTLQQLRPRVLLATHSTRLKEACVDYLGRRGYRIAPVIGTSVAAADELVAQPECESSVH
jgi:FkbM family methyltransferase